ncbi:MAG TPA: thiamine pyrophosphate-binding protein [Gemmataceae bacterium]|nr:thiamine pyrophosphate-binding protein [Gemmataceae bacterium]
MFDGNEVVATLKECGVTHVVWIPDSELGTWETALSSAQEPKLVRVCREGEAMAVAGGLLLAGQRPIVMIQCTGLFEAGDSLRNIVYDLNLPLFLVIGLRGYYGYQKGKRTDTCPVFAEPILRAWQVPYTLVDPQREPVTRLRDAYRDAGAKKRAGALLLAE